MLPHTHLNTGQTHPANGSIPLDFTSPYRASGFVLHDSGDSRREQGISKAGNRRVRTLAIEISWFWLRYQPNSKLTLWFKDRFGGGTKRMRRVGIVAMARRLLIALWHDVEHGVVPEGAELKPA